MTDVSLFFRAELIAGFARVRVIACDPGHCLITVDLISLWRLTPGRDRWMKVVPEALHPIACIWGHEMMSALLWFVLLSMAEVSMFFGADLMWTLCGNFIFVL